MGYKDDNYSSRVCNHHPETCTCKDWDINEKPKQERMYSEEEVLQLLLRLQQTESYDNLYDWFEQFKKK
jgi:hypothetical protein